MIVQIRGTSGSGKSWVMRWVMSELGGPEDIAWRPGKGKRKLPLYYTLSGSIVVLGHYESPCGGGDTIGSARQIYDLIQEVLKKHPGAAILCESLLLSEDSKWSLQLKGEGHDVRCLFLVTDVERCITQIKQRRAAAGNDKPFNEHNTRNRVAVIERARLKLTGAGILCRRVTADQAPGMVLNWLRQRGGG